MNQLAPGAEIQSHAGSLPLGTAQAPHQR